MRPFEKGIELSTGLDIPRTYAPISPTGPETPTEKKPSSETFRNAVLVRGLIFIYIYMYTACGHTGFKCNTL